MNIHIASVHEETKPFKCHICNASFVNLNVLKYCLAKEIRKLLHAILVRLVLLECTSILHQFMKEKWPSNKTNVILAMR